MSYYDKTGTRIDTDQWLALFRDKDYQIVKQDDLGDVKVSTVWLGLDHQYGDGPPLIFETMIFGGECDEDQWRDSTEADALVTHAHAVSLVKGEK